MTDGELFLSAAMICIWIGIPLGRIARAIEDLRDIASGRR